jgi:hypothetical protein
MGFDTPQSLAAELKVFTENEGDIYRQQTSMILKNLATKKASGKYNHDRAVDMFMYLAETGAKKYTREYGGPGASWHEMFPKDVRRIVASEWRNEFEVEYASGAYDNLLPKKYQPRSDHRATETKKLATMGFYKGERVSMHPATDAFMMGDRYGTVAKIGKSKIHVKMDKSGRTRLVLPGNLQHMEELGSI